MPLAHTLQLGESSSHSVNISDISIDLTVQDPGGSDTSEDSEIADSNRSQNSQPPTGAVEQNRTDANSAPYVISGVVHSEPPETGGFVPYPPLSAATADDATMAATDNTEDNSSRDACRQQLFDEYLKVSCSLNALSTRVRLRSSVVVIIFDAFLNFASPPQQTKPLTLS